MIDEGGRMVDTNVGATFVLRIHVHTCAGARAAQGFDVTFHVSLSIPRSAMVMGQPDAQFSGLHFT